MERSTDLWHRPVGAMHDPEMVAVQMQERRIERRPQHHACLADSRGGQAHREDRLDHPAATAWAYCWISHWAWLSVRRRMKWAAAWRLTVQ